MNAMPCLLLVEDHKDFREALKNFVAAHHLRVHLIEASTGEEAVMLARKKKPKAVVMDFSLGGINGLEAALRIKKQAPQCGIIMLTVYDPGEILRRDNLGLVSCFINKGNLYEELIPAIQDILAFENKIKDRRSTIYGANRTPDFKPHQKKDRACRRAGH